MTGGSRWGLLESDFSHQYLGKFRLGHGKGFLKEWYGCLEVRAVDGALVVFFCEEKRKMSKNAGALVSFFAFRTR